MAADTAQNADGGAGSGDQSSNGRTAHFASLAEQADIRQASHLVPAHRFAVLVFASPHSCADAAVLLQLSAPISEQAAGCIAALSSITTVHITC